MEKGLLIVGHGSRSLEGQKTFQKMIDRVRKKAPYKMVEGVSMDSFLEISVVMEKMVEREVGEILIIPYFLYEGIHIKRDLPKIVEGLSKKYKKIIFRMGQPIGASSLLSDIIIKIAQEMEK